MPAFKIPIKASTGVLTIDSQDVTCYARYVDIPEPSETTTDMGTWCDPTASVVSQGAQTVEIEWLNSFSDGTDDGLYDVLSTLADGLEHTFTFKPFGATTGEPSWTWQSIIPAPPMGRFQVDAPIIVPQTYAVSGLTYTKAV